ncbi:MAG: hypothetical protein Q9161_001263 [Pseudevernia consocians]
MWDACLLTIAGIVVPGVTLRIDSNRPPTDAQPQPNFEFILGPLRALPRRNAVEMLEQHAVLEVRFRRSYLNPQDTDWTRRFRTDVDLFNCVTKMPAQDLADQLTDGDLTAVRSLAPQSVIDEGDRFQQMNRRWDDQCLAISEFLIIHRHLIHKGINVCEMTSMPFRLIHQLTSMIAPA